MVSEIQWDSAHTGEMNSRSEMELAYSLEVFRDQSYGVYRSSELAWRSNGCHKDGKKKELHKMSCDIEQYLELLQDIRAM